MCVAMGVGVHVWGKVEMDVDRAVGVQSYWAVHFQKYACTRTSIFIYIQWIPIVVPCLVCNSQFKRFLSFSSPSFVPTGGDYIHRYMYIHTIARSIHLSVIVVNHFNQIEKNRHYSHTADNLGTNQAEYSNSNHWTSAARRFPCCQKFPSSNSSVDS